MRDIDSLEFITRKQELLGLLADRGAFNFDGHEDFVFMLPTVMPDELIMALFATRLKASGLTFDYYAGMPGAGDRLADLFDKFDWTELWCPAFNQPRRLQLMRAEVDGVWRIVPSPVNPPIMKNARVLFLSYELNDGSQELEAAEVVEGMGLAPSYFMSLVDREHIGGQLLDDKGYRPLSVFGRRELLRLLVYIGKLNHATAQRYQTIASLR